MTRRERWLVTRYGINNNQFDAMMRLQQGRCAICRCDTIQRRLHVDHDHKTKRVRGLLCFQCNRYRVSKNDLESARAVVRYLSNVSFDGRNLA